MHRRPCTRGSKHVTPTTSRLYSLHAKGRYHEIHKMEAADMKTRTRLTPSQKHTCYWKRPERRHTAASRPPHGAETLETEKQNRIGARGYLIYIAFPAAETE